MEKYKARIRLRMVWMSSVAVCVAIICLVFYYNQDRLPPMPDFARGFQVGAIGGLELVLVFLTVRYLISMRDEKALKKLYIQENDERTLLILQMTGAIGMTVCSIGLAFAAVIASFFDRTVFFTLLGSAVFTAVIRGSLKLYYHLKL